MSSNSSWHVMTHDERKALLEAYREAARRLYSADMNITISDDDSVQICPEGAYVQMVVWVPVIEVKK